MESPEKNISQGSRGTKVEPGVDPGTGGVDPGTGGVDPGTGRVGLDPGLDQDPILLQVEILPLESYWRNNRNTSTTLFLSTNLN